MVTSKVHASTTLGDIRLAVSQYGTVSIITDDDSANYLTMDVQRWEKVRDAIDELIAEWKHANEVLAPILEKDK